MMGLEATAGNPIRKKRKNKNEVKAYSLLGFPLAWWTLFFVLAFFSALIFSFTNVSLKSLRGFLVVKGMLGPFLR